MNKLLKKLLKKESIEPSSRITSETVVRHRERILAGGRRFKYPIQYTRHKLVINAIIISVLALITMLIIGWWQLYLSQNTSDFMYRVTKVIPVPVANVDGQSVLYSDYLMKFRSSVYYLEQKEQLNIKSDEGKKQLDTIKKQSLKDAIADAYAFKISKSLNISVTDIELESLLKSQRQSVDGEISQQTYDASTLDYLGWSPDEYRYSIKNGLLRQKVAYAIDTNALNIVNNISTLATNNPNIDLKSLPSTITDSVISYSVSGWVPKTNQDGGLAIEASKLNKLQLSGVIKSTLGDGFYYIRLLDINDSQVYYEYIQIPLTKFNEDLNNILNSDKTKKYISV